MISTMVPELPRFDAARVLVVGDAMLDRYWHGQTARISPEAPVLAREVDGTVSTADAADEGEGGPARRGWWQRTFGE